MKPRYKFEPLGIGAGDGNHWWRIYKASYGLFGGVNWQYEDIVHDKQLESVKAHLAKEPIVI